VNNRQKVEYRVLVPGAMRSTLSIAG